MTTTSPEEIAAGLTEAQRRAVLAGDVQDKTLPWCGCDFRSCGGWSWCKTMPHCLGLAVRSLLTSEGGGV